MKRRKRHLASLSRLGLGVSVALGMVGACSGQAAPGPIPRDAPWPPAFAKECDSQAAAWIWCDDFERDRLRSYFEYDSAGGRFVRASGVGLGGGYGLRATWTAPGQVSLGSLHLAFGRTPTGYVRPVDAGSARYRAIYWRFYLRNDSAWTGGGGFKLTRAQILATTNWAQAMLAPVWSGIRGNDRLRLMLDPMTGTDADGNLRATTYGDDANIRALGETRGQRLIFDKPNVGAWYCIELFVRLNDPGISNGEFALWIDDTLDARKTGLNWIGRFDRYGINTIFLENYWNQGSPRAQSRYMDNFVVSTDRIRCLPGIK